MLWRTGRYPRHNQQSNGSDTCTPSTPSMIGSATLRNRTKQCIFKLQKGTPHSMPTYGWHGQLLALTFKPIRGTTVSVQPNQGELDSEFEILRDGACHAKRIVISTAALNGKTEELIWARREMPTRKAECGNDKSLRDWSSAAT